MKTMIRVARIEKHYQENWGCDGVPCLFGNGPVSDLPSDFTVLKFPPRVGCPAWTFATRCMSQPEDDKPLELHCFSTDDDFGLVELLYITAHYHRTGSDLDMGHTVNFGRPWSPGSPLGFGLVSLPYLDGPRLEIMESTGARFLWLLPISSDEVAFKRAHGLDALEQAMERTSFDYLDPFRPNVI
ncbi:suppressor of fused domain protein [Sphingomonas alpina]|uniref:Suppressor of fused domain protein n=1 Tax=Sphingomonas alpina TaxID=653931 RepID=A0A7H0LF97_9SPHN|nr:suppressor of fused domain protein [Sphingomonas alpina]QNQ08350.1 suppressor of fused domain protein [Sphingomonas alpina]